MNIKPPSTSPSSTPLCSCVLVQCVDGFAEIQHPYVFLARAGFEELLAFPSARRAIVPLLPRVTPLFRRSLMSKNKDELAYTLGALATLVKVVQSDFGPFKSKFRVVLQRHATTRGPLQKRAIECVEILAEIQ